MLRKAFDLLPVAIFIGGGVFLLTLFVFKPETIGEPVLQYTDLIPAPLRDQSSWTLNIFSWIFLATILLISLDKVVNNKKILKTNQQKFLHGPTVGINCAFIASSFLLYQTNWSINLALIIIYIISFIILFQDGLIAGLSTTFTSTLVLFVLYLSLVFSSSLGAIIALSLILIGALVIKFSKR